MCRSLASATFEAGSVLREIGDFAFGLSGLKTVAIPASVGVIGKSAFLWCRSLASVIFEVGSALRVVGSWAFEDCPCAGSLKFPAAFGAAREEDEK
jgi:hypothetical protein